MATTETTIVNSDETQTLKPFVDQAVNNALGFHILFNAWTHLCEQTCGAQTDAMALLEAKRSEIIHDPESNQEALRTVIAVWKRDQWEDLPAVK